jgi:hypothetical protein
MSMADTQNSTLAHAASSPASPPSNAAAMNSPSHAAPGAAPNTDSDQIRP